MCLGMPGRVLMVGEGMAVVDCWGVERVVDTSKLEEPIGAGDHIIEHAGEAVRRIPDEEVFDVLGLYEILLSEAGEDPIGMDACRQLEKAAIV